MKLFGCKGNCDGTNCNSTAPGYANKGWHFFLFNLTADRAEKHDVWRTQRSEALAMFSRFQQWQASILVSQGPTENGCSPPPPPPPGKRVPIAPVAKMQNVNLRCGSSGGNHLSTVGGESPDACATECNGTLDVARAFGHGGQLLLPTHLDAPSTECAYFSWNQNCSECWLYHECDESSREGGGLVYNWTTWRLTGRTNSGPA